jgi:hypothetical protein
MTAILEAKDNDLSGLAIALRCGSAAAERDGVVERSRDETS